MTQISRGAVNRPLEYWGPITIGAYSGKWYFDLWSLLHLNKADEQKDGFGISYMGTCAPAIDHAFQTQGETVNDTIVKYREDLRRTAHLQSTHRQ